VLGDVQFKGVSLSARRGQVLESISIARASLYMFSSESFPVQAQSREAIWDVALRPYGHAGLCPPCPGISAVQSGGRLRLVGGEFKI